MKTIKKSGTQQPRATREFTDREEPQSAFWRQYCAMCQKKDEQVHVLAYYGVGGIGKTTLLKKLKKDLTAGIPEEIQKKLQAENPSGCFEAVCEPFCVLYNLADFKDMPSTLETLKNHLEDTYGVPFPLFDYAHYVYARKMDERPNAPEVKGIVEKSSVLRLLMSGLDLMSGFDLIPYMGIATKLLSVADRGGARLKDYLHRHSKIMHQIEYMEADSLYKKLSALFATDLATYMEKSQKPLVIFLDTYENLVNELLPGEPLSHDLWLRGEDGLVQSIPHVLWVIAGREKLKWARMDADWEDCLEQHLLGDLSETDSVYFLETAGVTDAKLRGELYRLTGGVPLYLDLCVDQHEALIKKNIVPTIEHFGTDTSKLMENFLKYMDDPQRDTVFTLACLAHWDDATLHELWTSARLPFSATSYEKAKELSFVLKEAQGGFRMHQTIREVLIEKCPSLIKTQVGQGLETVYKPTVDEKDVHSKAYAKAIERLLQSAILLHAEDEALRLCYAENLYDAIKKMAEVGQFERTIGLMEEMLARAAKNKKSRLHAEVLCDFAWIKDLAGQYTEAKALAEESLQLYTELLGEDDLDTIRAMSTLGSVLQDLGGFDKAKALQEEVLEQRKQILGEDHPDTLGAMNNLALTLGKLGAFDKAKALQEEVLEQRKRLLGENHPDTLAAMNNLANTLGALGVYDRDKALQEEALKKRKQVLGESHPATLSAMNNLACTLHAMGRYKEAKMLYEDVVKKRKQILGETHPDTLDTMHNLTNTLGALGMYSEAKALQKEVFDKRKQILGEDHPDTLGTMNNLANMFYDLGAYEKAHALYEDVLKKRKQILGEDHPATLTTMNNLALTLRVLGKHSEAKAIKEEVLDKRKQVSGENHPDTLTAMSNLAVTLSDMGAHSEAKVLKEEVLDKRKRILGENHPDTLTAMNNLANTLSALGEYDRAKALKEDVLKKRKQILGEDHPSTILAMNNLAITLDDIGAYENARALQEEVLEKRRKILGKKHPVTIKAAKNLVYTLLKLEQFAEALAIIVAYGLN